MTPPPTIRVFIAGDSGSGKTTRAYTMFLSRFPRVVYVDLTGEWIERADTYSHGAYDGIRAILNCAKTGGQWSVAIGMDDPDDMAVLVDWLIPVPDLSQSPVLAFGGMAILVDEVDLMAPPRTSSREIRTLYRRSRHVGLSVISTTQRPANVSREVSSQSTHVIAHRLREPLDRDYIADVLRWDRVAVEQWIYWTEKHPHGAALANLATGRVLWLPDSGPPVSAPEIPRRRQIPSGVSQEQEQPTEIIDPQPESGEQQE